MNIKGCLLSPDKADKILVAASLEPKSLVFSLADKSKKALAKVEVEIIDGHVFLVIKFAAYLNQPVQTFHVATL